MNQKISSLRMQLRLGLIAVLAVVLPITSVSGQEKPEPSAIIAIASIDEQLKDIEYLAEATSESIGQMSGLIRFQAQGFLPGVDFKKPIGALLYFQEGEMEPKAIGFFPVKNLDDILDKISEFAELEEKGDTVTIIPDNGDELTLVNKNGYAFVSDSAEMLKNLPADPASMIADQVKKYNLSAKLFPQKIPAELRDMAMNWIEENSLSALDQMDDLQADIQEAQLEMQMKQIEMLVQEVDEITMGFDADKSGERVYFDFNMAGVKGSEFQKRLAGSKTEAPSNFTGFLKEKAALTFHNCSGITKEDCELYTESIENMRDTLLEQIDSEGDKIPSELAEKISGKLVDVMKKTLDAGTMDMGGVVYTNDGFDAAFGGKIVDAPELEASIKEIVANLESQIEDDEVVFNLNSGTHSGFNLHQILIKVDEEEFDDTFIKLFGERVNVILGIGKDQVYVAVGKNSESTIKKSIDLNAKQSSKADVIGQYNVFIAPIMKLAADIDPSEPMAQMLRDKIEEVGKDRIRVTWDLVDGQIRGRMEMQDGIFQMFGVMAEAMSGMGGGADF